MNDWKLYAKYNWNLMSRNGRNMDLSKTIYILVQNLSNKGCNNKQSLYKNHDNNSQSTNLLSVTLSGGKKKEEDLSNQYYPYKHE